MADRKRATGGSEREGMMCDVLIFGACTPGYDSDPSHYADVGRTKTLVTVKYIGSYIS
jgi:hypothetical protein